MNRIPVVMCIDVEPDQRQLARNQYEAWSGFETTYDYFSDLRQQLQTATGCAVHFSWFLRMDPQIAHAYGTAAWVVNRYSHIVEKIKSAGDALGLHVHAWRWDESSGSWFADFGNQEWVDHCVRVGFESFRESVKQRCLYFRFGDHWMNNATLSLVEKLGARFDLTLEPKSKGAELLERYTGSFLNCIQMPQHPYRPSKSELRESAPFLRRRGIWLIPLSTGSTDWSPDSLQDRARNTARGNGARPASLLNYGEGALEGCLERVDSELISGWAYDSGRPDTPLEVEVWDGDALLTAAQAATFRADLLAAGKGNGSHCFNIVVPSCLKDGSSHSIRANVAGTCFDLNDSPKDLTYNDMNDADEYMTLNLSSKPWPICRIIDKLVDSAKPYLAMVVRTDVVNHSDLYSHLRQTFDHILSHRSVGQLAFETPSEMIKRRRRKLRIADCELRIE